MWTVKTLIRLGGCFVGFIVWRLNYLFLFHRITNSLRNNDLDSNFNLNFVKKKYTTVLDASLKYGKNLKDKHNKNRLELSVDATHKLESPRKQVNYSVDFKFPAKVTDMNKLFLERLSYRLSNLLNKNVEKEWQESFSICDSIIRE